jgi:adenylate cyclase
MIYRFENFELDLDQFELRQDGVAVEIQPQVFTLISLLVSNPERMVSKDEMVERIWDGRFVSEAAISSRVRLARQALHDDGKEQRLIRTVHGKGFRFVGQLSEEISGESGVASEPEQPRSNPTIMVIPFSNVSASPDQEYFADAITQDIISTLSKYRWLNIVARNTSFGYKGRSVDIGKLRSDHDVDYVVEGSVQRAGEQIRVATQLVDAGTGNQLWADRYDREIKDVFAVQDEITGKIVARLEPEIGTAERQKVIRAVRRDLHAWDSFHLGISHFYKFTAQDNLAAQALLQQSRQLDPQFGEAHAWWAYAVILGMVYWDTEPSQELQDEALDATKLALRLDDQNAVFYALKARVQLARREYGSALSENEMAIKLNPTFAAAHCGLADSLAYEGRYDEAIERFNIAIDLSPNDPQRWAFLTYGALALIFKGDYESALSWTNRASLIPNCQYWALAHKAVALAHLGREGDASSAVDKLLAARHDFTIAFAKRRLFYIKDPQQLKCYVEGLRLAGVPD